MAVNEGGLLFIKLSELVSSTFFLFGHLNLVSLLDIKSILNS